MPTEIASVAELDAQLSQAGSNLVVIDFHATWCGPCKVIAPVYEDLAKKNTSSVFLKCDIDRAKDVAAKYTIRAVPTFILIKKGSVVETIQGANRNALSRAVERHSGSQTHDWGSGGQTLGGGASPSQISDQGQPSNQLRLLLALFAVYAVYVFATR